MQHCRRDYGKLECGRNAWNLERCSSGMMKVLSQLLFLRYESFARSRRKFELLHLEMLVVVPTTMQTQGEPTMRLVQRFRVRA